MRRLAAGTALVLTTLAFMAVLWELRGAVLIFFLSLGTSAALRPAIEQFHRWGLPRALALGVTYLGCVIGFVGLSLALVFPLAADLQQLGHDSKTAYDNITTNWPKGNSLQRAVAQRLPSWEDLRRAGWRVGQDAAADVTAAAPTATTPQMDEDEPASPFSALWTHRAVHTLLGVTWGFFGTILNVLIIVVLSLYWSIDRVHFERLWLSLLDVGRRQRARETGGPSKMRPGHICSARPCKACRPAACWGWASGFCNSLIRFCPPPSEPWPG